jgi:uncharacterized membrane protein
LPKRQSWSTFLSQWEFLLACKKEEAEHVRFLYALDYSETSNYDKFAFEATIVPVAVLSVV